MSIGPIETGDPDPSLVEQPELGEILRSLRQARGQTIGVVATGTGVSESFIAMVEKGRSDISLGRLYRLLRFYGVGLADLLPRKVQPEVIRDGEARQVNLREEGISAFLLAPDRDRRMTPMLAVHKPGACIKDVPPYGDECFLYVLDGRLVVEREGKQPVVLGPGDSFYFTRSETLTSSTVGTEPARVIAVLAHEG